MMKMMIPRFMPGKVYSKVLRTRSSIRADMFHTNHREYILGPGGVKLGGGGLELFTGINRENRGVLNPNPLLILLLIVILISKPIKSKIRIREPKATAGNVSGDSAKGRRR